MKDNIRIKDQESICVLEANANHAPLESEETFRIIFENASDGILLADVETKKLFMSNKRLREMFGYSESEIKELSVNDVHPEENLPEIIKNFELQARGIIDLTEDIPCLRKDGTVFYADISTTRVIIGGKTYNVGFFRDITMQKQAEEKLQRYQANLTALIENTEDIVLSRDLEDRAVVFNHGFIDLAKKLFNLEIKPGISTVDHLPEDRKAHLKNVLAMVKKGIGHKEERIWNIDGETHYFEASHIPIIDNGDIIGTAEFTRDITNKKLAENALRESEHKFRTMVENVNDGIYMLDFNGTIIDVNENACKMVGYERDELIGSNLSKIDSPVTDSERDYRKEQVLRNGSVLFEGFLVRKDGSTVPVEISSKLVSKEGNGLIQSVIRDISMRKKAETELHKFGEAVLQASEGIAVTELDGTISYINPAFELISGYSADEVIGRNPRILKSGHQDKVFYDEFWTTILKGDKWSGRVVNKRKNGELFTAECSVSPVKDKEGNIVNFVWIIRDISPELTLEHRLLQAQKMEAIGSLAGGIAHDFNNILSPIILQAEIAMMDLDPDNPLQLNLNEIYRAGKRARDLVKQILTFARRNEENRVPLRASAVVKETVRFLRSTIPTTIEIKYDVKTRHDTILADPTQLNQIVMNLCTNAAYAMHEKGGILSVIIDDETIEQDETRGFFGIVPGKYMKLSVVDMGPGMPRHIINKIFEPYFTTKGKGEGTGLGLAVIHGIVKDYKGDIVVESEVGKGTAFHIFIPIVKANIIRTSKQRKELPGGKENILLVDDERIVIKTVKKMLERLGYNVVERTSSVEAFEAFRYKPEKFDLVITDQTMPKMTGKELAREMMSVRPDIPIILCTGFSDQIDEKEADAMGIKAFIMKPIIMNEIADTIRKVLDNKVV